MKIKVIEGKYNSCEYFIDNLHIGDAHYDGIHGRGYILKCHLGTNLRKKTLKSYDECLVELKRLVEYVLKKIE